MRTNHLRTLPSSRADGSHYTRSISHIPILNLPIRVTLQSPPTPHWLQPPLFSSEEPEYTQSSMDEACQLLWGCFLQLITSDETGPSLNWWNDDWSHRWKCIRIRYLRRTMNYYTKNYGECNCTNYAPFYKGKVNSRVTGNKTAWIMPPFTKAKSIPWFESLDAFNCR